MNTRLIISLLCAGALAFACGPRSRSEQPVALASMVALRSTPAAPRPTRSSTTRDEVKLKSQFDIKVVPSEVRFTFVVKNVGGKHAELDFPNGQTHDFVVADSTGRAVWQWSNGRIFTQIVRNKQLGAGDVMVLQESWKHPSVPRGRYTVTAVLKSTNYPAEQRAELLIP